MFSRCETLNYLLSECFLCVNVLFLCLVNVFYMWTSYFCVQWMFSTFERLISVFSECFLGVNILFFCLVNVYYVWMSYFCVQWMFSTFEHLISVFSECFLGVKLLLLCLLNDFYVGILFLCWVNVLYVWMSYFCVQWLFSMCGHLISVFSECFLGVNSYFWA